jgi:hypothetical protein
MINILSYCFQQFDWLARNVQNNKKSCEVMKSYLDVGETSMGCTLEPSPGCPSTLAIANLNNSGIDIRMYVGWAVLTRTSSNMVSLHIYYLVHNHGCTYLNMLRLWCHQTAKGMKHSCQNTTVDNGIKFPLVVSKPLYHSKGWRCKTRNRQSFYLTLPMPAAAARIPPVWLEPAGVGTPERHSRGRERITRDPRG